MGGYRHVVDGTVQIPLPDDPTARAKAFAEVAMAWSTMISSLDHLLVQSREPTRLVGRMVKAQPGDQPYTYQTQWNPGPVVVTSSAPAAPPPPQRDFSKHAAMMRAAKAAKAAAANGKPRKRRPTHIVAGVPAA